ncbi:unnamed protein product, partial [Adineta steineri]
LAKIILPGGSKDVPVGKLCAIIVEKEEDIAAFKDFKDDESKSSTKKTSVDEEASSAPKTEKKEKESTSKIEQQQQPPSTSKKDKSQEQKSQSSSEGSRTAASPLAKKLAQEKGINLESVQGSGPNGRVVAEDVEKFIKEGGSKVKSETKKTKDTQQTPSKTTKKDKETGTRTGGYDEQKV